MSTVLHSDMDMYYHSNMPTLFRGWEIKCKLDIGIPCQSLRSLENFEEGPKRVMAEVWRAKIDAASQQSSLNVLSIGRP